MSEKKGPGALACAKDRRQNSRLAPPHTSAMGLALYLLARNPTSVQQVSLDLLSRFC